jgi:hypothetical protein
MASRPSVVWVFMISNSCGVKLARLEQDAVRDADLADVVQRRRLEQQSSDGASSVVAEARMLAQVLGQRRT